MNFKDTLINPCVHSNVGALLVLLVQPVYANLACTLEIDQWARPVT